VIESHTFAAGRLDTVELRIPAKAEWVAVARLAVSAIANRLAFSFEEIEDLKLALSEACANCIQHAEAEGEGIDITFDVLSDAVRIVVRDRIGHGKSAGGPPVASQMRDERTEGVGMYIIQSLMDVVEYKVDGRAGTELVMTKRVRA
jgi:serine/threonine-protein kinase RsbW